MGGGGRRQGDWGVGSAGPGTFTGKSFSRKRSQSGEGDLFYFKKTLGGGGVGRRSEGLGVVVWVYKIGLKWPVTAMAITRIPVSLCV